MAPSAPSSRSPLALRSPRRSTAARLTEPNGADKAGFFTPSPSPVLLRSRIQSSFANWDFHICITRHPPIPLSLSGHPLKRPRSQLSTLPSLPSPQRALDLDEKCRSQGVPFVWGASWAELTSLFVDLGAQAAERANPRGCCRPQDSQEVTIAHVSGVSKQFSALPHVRC